MNLMVLPLWAWIVFYVLVLFMLVADLKMFGKKGQHEVLFWGIFGALVLRSIFIFAGAAMSASNETSVMNEYINSLGALVGFNLNAPHIEVPTLISLAVIFGVLLLSMLFSVLLTRKIGKQTVET